MRRTRHTRAQRLLVAAASATLALTLAGPASAHDGITDDPDDTGTPGDHTVDHDADLRASDAEEIVSSGPSAKVTKNLSVMGRGERLATDVTTDVWAYDGYAYTGTFSTLCSDGEGGDESGIWVWDVRNKTKPTKVGVIESLVGTKANDVKVASMNSGDILVLSNEICGDGGVGGVDVYDVSDPENPVRQSRIVVDDANVALREAFEVADVGVHNMYLFTQGDRDYVGVSGEADFGNFQIFDITDPTSPELVSTWGPENAEFADELASFGLSSFAEGDLDFWLDEGFDLLVEADGWLFNGFGASANRIMHDLYVTDDGTQAYVNFWDAGMVLLDISDPADPVYVSTAIAPDSEDGEVNSHSVWPTADGSVVVEGEEDFAPYESIFTVEGVGDFEATPGSINPSGEVNGPTVYVGLACDGDPLPTATADGQVALIQRGVCAFTEKGLNVTGAGYDAMVVFNDQARGDALVAMGGDPVEIPGVFVGHSTGLAIMNAASADDLVIGDPGRDVSTTQVWNGWSGLRLWDYSDPANPVLASTFNTQCSALEDASGCMEGGTYSVHNVIVEGDLAYVSWYYDGVVVVDISDPYNPVEVARYHERGDAFEAQNAGAQDVWGIYKEPKSPWIYASDRNGGLYVLKAFGAGSAKQGRNGSA